MFNRGLGINLREQRLQAGLTQDQLALHAGMSRGSIANIERGEQTPGLYRLVLICEALACDLRDVLPDGVLSVESVASAISDHVLSDVQKVRRQAGRMHMDSASTQ